MSIMKSLLLIIVPICLIVLLGWLMQKYTCYDARRAALVQGGVLDEDKPKMLNQRLNGYTALDVIEYWKLLQCVHDRDLLTKEKLALEVDLIYPFLYGAILLTALLMGWGAIGRPFSILWLTVPVMVLVCADWTENLIQINQLKAFISDPLTIPGELWMRIASFATQLKLILIYVLFPLQVVLAGFSGYIAIRH